MTRGLASRGVKATLIACVGTLALLALALAFDQHHQGAVWPFFRYQICALTLAALVVLAMRRLVTPRFAYLRRGSPAAPARRIPVLMVAASESWRRVGITFGALAFAATVAWLWIFDGAPDGSTRWIYAVALALPLALSNACVEEIITRWSVVEGLAADGARWAPYLSAGIFGAAHIFGVPGGISGGVMAAFIGWLLAISIQDTKGLFWAITIHFFLDLAIFSFSLGHVL